jgi:hypothetical protein
VPRYEEPELTELGSAAELTAGATGQQQDPGGGTQTILDTPV